MLVKVVYRLSQKFAVDLGICSEAMQASLPTVKHGEVLNLP